MVGADSETNFFMINSDTATASNHFPTEGVAGALVVYNLYNTHIIQIYYTTTADVYERTCLNFLAGGQWSAWNKKW